MLRVFGYENIEMCECLYVIIRYRGRKGKI